MRKISFMALALLLFGWGCVSTSVAAPADFSFSYNYSNGALPPPYHYEYKITVKADGTVQMNYMPDYIVEATIEDATPVWVEKTTVSKEKLNKLYQQMDKIGVFNTVWQEPKEKTVGGPSQFLKVTANGKNFEIPVWAAEKEEIKNLYSDISALFSADVWQKIANQTEEYQKAHKSN